MADFSELQSRMEVQFMDALTAAYDLGDSELVEELQDAYKQNQIGMERDDFDGVTSLRNLAEKLADTATDSEGLAAIDSELYDMQENYARVLNYNAPELKPPLGLLETKDDVEKILERDGPQPDEPKPEEPQPNQPVYRGPGTFSL